MHGGFVHTSMTMMSRANLSLLTVRQNEKLLCILTSSSYHDLDTYVSTSSSSGEGQSLQSDAMSKNGFILLKHNLSPNPGFTNHRNRHRDYSFWHRDEVS